MCGNVHGFLEFVNLSLGKAFIRRQVSSRGRVYACLATVVRTVVTLDLRGCRPLGPEGVWRLSTLLLERRPLLLARLDMRCRSPRCAAPLLPFCFVTAHR